MGLARFGGFLAVFAIGAAGPIACAAAHGDGFDTADGGGEDSGHVWPSGGKDGGAGATTKDGAAISIDGSVGGDSAISGPTADECLEGWASYDGGCPAPVITDSYVGNGCVGTTGWFVDGANFQLRQHNTGIADYGPQSFGANGNQMNWNVITTTQLCVTVSAGAKDAWVGHTIYVVNPDGKSSNSVVVGDKL